VLFGNGLSCNLTKPDKKSIRRGQTTVNHRFFRVLYAYDHKCVGAGPIGAPGKRTGVYALRKIGRPRKEQAFQRFGAPCFNTTVVSLATLRAREHEAARQNSRDTDSKWRMSVVAKARCPGTKHTASRSLSVVDFRPRRVRYFSPASSALKSAVFCPTGTLSSSFTFGFFESVMEMAKVSAPSARARSRVLEVVPAR